MALNLKLQMRLSQQLIMTPQLQQAIKLLQLSRNELEELIDQALIENPVLEETDENTETEDQPEEIKTREESVETLAPDPGPTQAELEWQQYKEAGSGVIPERHRGEDGEDYGLEATLAGTDSLQDHLLWQAEMSGLSPLECTIAEYLIGNIDDDGYLTVTVEELLQLNPELQTDILGAVENGAITVPVPESLDSEYIPLKFQAAKPPPPSKKLKQPPVFEEDEVARPGPVEAPAAADPRAVAVVEGVVRFIQTFDPTSAGSRCLKECLEVQLRQAGMEDSLAFRVVAHDLKLLESKDLRKIARRQKAELDDVIEAYKLIMALEPKPGRPFVSERPQHIIPDVYIYKFSSGDRESDDQVGQFRVTLNDSGIPRLRISSYYRDMANGRAAGSSLTKEYIQEKIKAGNWLMKSIEQRQRTIFRVTKSILKHQYEFFEKGINFLKPLVLKDVAEDIQVHESTVSRITTNKYVHTPQGIYELKYFFTSGIDQGHGEVISSKKIKDLIQKIIVKEDVREPFTDIQIAERLHKEMKIKVARRTVAKYREALNLLPSNKRKQMF
jgi:RNA polymerase sigma-54 factor